MNRELKFRAWLDGKMGYWPDWHITFTGHFVKEENGGLTTIVGSMQPPIMQYTGLKDKNGVEIYEGDILQYRRYYALKRWWSETSDITIIEQEMNQQRADSYLGSGIVRYEDGEWTAGYPVTGKTLHRGEYLNRGTGSTSDYEEKVWDFEVIGNIYENPKLLEGAK